MKNFEGAEVNDGIAKVVKQVDDFVVLHIMGGQYQGFYLKDNGDGTVAIDTTRTLGLCDNVFTTVEECLKRYGKL